MKNIIKLEEAFMFGLAVYALTLFNVEWWWYLVLFLGPDISMIGYVAGNTVGAIAYNVFHHKGLAVLIFATGFVLPNELLQLVGIVLFGHASMDRMMGYGLKLKEGFKFTHLGPIGKK